MTEIMTSLYDDLRCKKIKLIQPEECDNCIYYAIVNFNVCSNTTHVNYIL